MAPKKNARASSKKSLTNTTFSKLMPQDENLDVTQTQAERKTENNTQNNDQMKRSALGDLSKNVANNKFTIVHTEKDIPRMATRSVTRRQKEVSILAVRASVEEVKIKIGTNCEVNKPKTNDALPATLLPIVRHQVQKVTNKPTLATAEIWAEGVENVEKANWDDIYLMSHCGPGIFNYLKQCESEFKIDDYMQRQNQISKVMRSLLVDWMVKIQEAYQLNQETLYLSVKIVDLFLCKKFINGNKLLPLGVSALFTACKFNESTTTLAKIFLHNCEGGFKHKELIEMQVIILKTIKFDLEMPLCYRFLNRFSCYARTQTTTLTLARYILELSLMDYDCITLSDSKIACAALFMALRLNGGAIPWSDALIFYTGYRLQDFAEIVPILNAGLHRKPQGTLKTIRSKYSHKKFHEVAKVSLMTTEKLFENNLDVIGINITAPDQQK